MHFIIGLSIKPATTSVQYSKEVSKYQSLDTDTCSSAVSEHSRGVDSTPLEIIYTVDDRYGTVTHAGYSL